VLPVGEGPAVVGVPEYGGGGGTPSKYRFKRSRAVGSCDRVAALAPCLERSKFLGVAAPRLQSDGRQAMGQQLGLFLSSALHHPRPFQKIQIIWIETGAGRRLSFSPHPSEKSKLFGLEQSKSYASPRGIDSMTKRPIDRKRDAGGAMEIGVPDDQSAITAIFPIGDDLYVVKERGIYEVKLADRIDPNRTNIA